MKRRKYKNTPVMVDGIKFDSKKEAAYYATLKLREKAGEVLDIEIHPVYKLATYGKPVLYPNGRQARYTADFRFYDRVEERLRVVDTKGHDTDASKLRRAFVKAIWGVDVEIV